MWGRARVHATSRAELRSNSWEEGKSGESTTWPLLGSGGGKGAQERPGEMWCSPDEVVPAEDGLAGPRGRVPVWAGSTMPEPGQGRGDVACQG